MPVPETKLTGHAKDALEERAIPEEWVWRTITTPDRTEIRADNNTHYIKAIPEYGGRFLRVVVNPHVTPRRVVTVFFDRRLRRDHETQSGQRE
ncbi:MAG: DUF4258 domain-containing protein [Planctomycetes bacterium]|nr:DUF4258 domain-containing protein [Planctomycetota bacterium]